MSGKEEYDAISHVINGEEGIGYTKPIFGGEYSIDESREGTPVKEGYILAKRELFYRVSKYRINGNSTMIIFTILYGNIFRCYRPIFDRCELQKNPVVPELNWQMNFQLYSY